MTQEIPGPLLTEEEVMSSAKRVKETGPQNYDYGRGEFRCLVFEDLVSVKGLPTVKHEVGGRIPDFDNQAVQSLNADLRRFEKELQSQS